MAKRKARSRSHVIADMSLHFLSYIIVSCTFTVEPTAKDYGYDLSIFTFDSDGHYESGNIFVQLKATDDLRVDPHTREIKFRISKRDVMTWEGEPFPAYLVVFDARRGAAYSIYLQRHFAEVGISSATITGASVIVRLPSRQLDAETIRGWRDDKNAILGQIGAVKHVQGGDLQSAPEDA